MPAHTRMISVFSFAILIVVCITLDISAQRTRTTSIRPTSVEQRNRTLRRFTNELQQHSRALQRTLSRYLSSGDPFTPYLSAKHFWLELRRSRTEFTPNVMSRSKTEKIELWRAYTQLEMDVLRVMLDDQLGLFQNELELSETQQERISLILRSDAEKKLKLLAVDAHDDSFFRNLSGISNETEAEVRNILLPEQLRVYDKRQTELEMMRTA